MKMHQIIAIESGIKKRTKQDLTNLYHTLQRPVSFQGQTKEYTPLDDDGVVFPAEQQLVQHQAEDVLRSMAEINTELYDCVATKDFGNCGAVADVMLDGEVLLSKVPATHLLFLEKQLIDIQTILNAMPVLDPQFKWNKNEAGGYRSDTVQTTKTAKTHKVVQMAPATEHHPEQAQLVAEDIVIGNWATTKLSGAVTQDRKKQLLGRVRDLLVAVKFAREEANSVEIEPQAVGNKIFNYLLK